MSNKKLYLAWIKELLENNGPMGVSAIAKQLDLPLASVQHFLTKQQKELIQLDDKKWAIRPSLEQAFSDEAVELITEMDMNQLMKEYQDMKAERDRYGKMADTLFYYIQGKLNDNL